MTQKTSSAEQQRRLREIDRQGARKAREALHKVMKRNGHTPNTKNKHTTA
ncbi:hypothetical protein [Corynebacterium sp. CNJ-954]|nr:hypothetical protein [Corynebacterium sp. CNJ-954]